MTTPTDAKLGWIGTGRMGYALAERLAKAGCDLTAWNRTRAKAEPLAHCHHLSIAEDWWLRHRSAHLDRLDADEFRLKPRVAVLQEHLDHFPEVPLELIEHFAVAVRAGEARDVAQHSPVSGSCSTAVKRFMGRILESVVQ